MAIPDYPYSSSDINSAESQLATDLTDGVVEKQVGDRRIRYMDPLRRAAAIEQLAANIRNESDGGILKIKFKDAT
jgi:hypothetical protein